MQEDRPLGYYLRRALGQIGDGSYASEIEVRRVYDQLVGDLISRLTQSFSLQNGTLLLRVATPTLKHELLCRRSGLRCSINDYLGREVVKKIVIL